MADPEAGPDGDIAVETTVHEVPEEHDIELTDEQIIDGLGKEFQHTGLLSLERIVEIFSKEVVDVTDLGDLDLKAEVGKWNTMLVEMQQKRVALREANAVLESDLAKIGVDKNDIISDAQREVNIRDEELTNTTATLQKTNMTRDAEIERLESALTVLHEQTDEKVECLEEQIAGLKKSGERVTEEGERVTFETTFAEGDPLQKQKTVLFEAGSEARMARTRAKRDIMNMERDQGVAAQELRRESQRAIEDAEVQLEREAEDRRRLNTKQAFKKSEVLQVEVAASSDRVHTQLKDNRSLTEDRHVTDLERSVRRSLLTEAEARNAKLKAQLERTIAKHARLQEENQVLASRSEARRAELAAEAALAANRPQMGDTVAAAERRIDMFEMVAIDHAISRVRKHSKAARAEAKRLRAELDFKKGELERLGRQMMQIAQAGALKPSLAEAAQQFRFSAPQPPTASLGGTRRTGRSWRHPARTFDEVGSPTAAKVLALPSIRQR